MGRLPDTGLLSDCVHRVGALSEMNETLRRELARLREHNETPMNETVTHRRSPKRRRVDESVGSATLAVLPAVTKHIPTRSDVRVEMIPSHDSLQNQIMALREEVRSLRTVLQRTFRTGANGLQTPM